MTRDEIIETVRERGLLPWVSSIGELRFSIRKGEKQHYLGSLVRLRNFTKEQLDEKISEKIRKIEEKESERGDDLSISDNLLMVTVDAGVRLALLNLKEQGIVPDNTIFEMARERMKPLRESDVSEAAFYANKKHTPLVMKILIDSLAVLAHAPGGVDFCGIHFESKGYKHE